MVRAIGASAKKVRALAFWAFAWAVFAWAVFGWAVFGCLALGLGGFPDLAHAGPRPAGLDISDIERAALRAEIRTFLLESPEIVDNALNPPDRAFARAVRHDIAILTDAAPVLFGATARGIGARTPTKTVAFYESYPCPDCADAWDDLVAMTKANPGLRVEPRFAQNDGHAQLLLSVLAHQGQSAYEVLRRDLWAGTPIGPRRQDRMFRAAPGDEARVFAALDLDSVPSYVLPKLILRGAMPPVVLQKHLRD